MAHLVRICGCAIRPTARLKQFSGECRRNEPGGRPKRSEPRSSEIIAGNIVARLLSAHIAHKLLAIAARVKPCDLFSAERTDFSPDYADSRCAVYYPNGPDEYSGPCVFAIT